MDYKQLITIIGFTPKENTISVFSKKYQQAEGYCIEIDLEKQSISVALFINKAL